MELQNNKENVPSANISTEGDFVFFVLSAPRSSIDLITTVQSLQSNASVPLFHQRRLRQDCLITRTEWKSREPRRSSTLQSRHHSSNLCTHLHSLFVNFQDDDNFCLLETESWNIDYSQLKLSKRRMHQDSKDNSSPTDEHYWLTEHLPLGR